MERKEAIKEQRRMKGKKGRKKEKEKRQRENIIIVLINTFKRVVLPAPFFPIMAILESMSILREAFVITFFSLLLS